MKVTLRHYASGHEIKCKKGFSWTTLFFGAFVPLLRGDLKWFFIMLITNVLVAVITYFIGFIIPWIIFASIYNGRYIADLGKKGYLEIPSDNGTKLPPGEYRIRPGGREL